MGKPTHILDYSSPVEEHRRNQAADEQHRRSVEDYNEATFGERRPFAIPIWRLIGYTLLGGVLVMLVPPMDRGTRRGLLLTLVITVELIVLVARRAADRR